MKRSIWYSAVINLMLVLAFISPAQASILTGSLGTKDYSSIDTQAVMDDVMALAKVRNQVIQNELDPIKAKREVRSAKKIILSDIEEDLKHVQNPAISLNQIREVYRAKVIFNGRQKMSSLKIFVGSLKEKDLDAVVQNSFSAEQVYRTRFFAGYANLQSLSSKRNLVSTVLEKEFRGQQRDALQKIQTMQRDDFIRELKESREIVNSKDWSSIMVLIAVLLLVAVVVALAANTTPANDDNYGGGNNPPNGGGCTYGSQGSFWQFVNSWTEYNCSGYDQWGNSLCRDYTCYRYQRYDSCTNQAVSPSDFKTDCY